MARLQSANLGWCKSRGRSASVAAPTSLKTATRTSALILAVASVPVFFSTTLRSAAQVFVVGAKSATGTMPAFHPTNVELDTMPLEIRTGQLLIRLLSSEQGFAARPLPMGGKGLILRANGELSPDAQEYQKVLYEKGTSAAAGDRVVITNVFITRDRIRFELNGGPDYKHKYLRHISIGVDPTYTTPVVQDDGIQPTGARVTLQFKNYVPEMSGDDLKALLAPVIDFDVKSPVKAYTDTLPPKIRDAILAHQVLVGMNHRMVLASMGQPDRKVREKKDGAAYEEWIFGQPPQEVDFVRFTGDRVSWLEIAALGKPLVVRTVDETDGYTPQVRERQIAMGDRSPDADPSQNKPPTLLKQGESGASSDGEKPVQFPTQKIAANRGEQ